MCESVEAVGRAASALRWLTRIISNKYNQDTHNSRRYSYSKPTLYTLSTYRYIRTPHADTHTLL